jgi:hypothetical protein
MTQPSAPEAVCASCGNPASGRFCSSCGASLEPVACAGCGEMLSPGARFCHSCGRAQAPAPNDVPLSSPGRAAPASSLPWIVAAIALITLLAFLAGSAFNRRRGSSLDAPQNALPQAGLDDRGAAGDGTEPVRGPDISQLSPQERADRLFNRVMLLNSQGKTDSVLFFAPMAIEAYQMLSPMNADQRYDLGRVAEAAGALPLARAQADTILRENKTHLLGLILGARIAQLEKRTSDLQKLEAALLQAYPSESAKKLPEYERHAADITSAVTDARRSKQN